MKVVILQSNYIPWKGYFDLAHDADLFIFYDEVKYTKNDWRNRNKINTSNGVQWLSIPIDKDAVKLKISEVEIKDKRWQEQHYKSLYYSYKGAAHFKQLESMLENVYKARTWDRLSQLNQHLISHISSLVGIQTRFEDSAQYKPEGERVQKLLNLLKQVGATQYISGPSARDYLNGSEHLFSEQGIELVYKKYPSYPVYPQQHKDFHHDVSILDLIANVPYSEIKKYIWEGVQS